MTVTVVAIGAETTIVLGWGAVTVTVVALGALMVTVSAVFCTSGVEGMTVTVPEGSVRVDSVRNRRAAVVEVPDAEASQETASLAVGGTGDVAVGAVELQLIVLAEIKKRITIDRIFVIIHLLDRHAAGSSWRTESSIPKEISRKYLRIPVCTNALTDAPYKAPEGIIQSRLIIL